MRSMRDSRTNDPAFVEWQKAYAAEQAATPEAQFKRAADADAKSKQHVVLTQQLSDEYMSGFGKVVRPPFNENLVPAAMAQFVAESDYVKSRANSEVLVEFIFRNNLSPADIESYRIAHAILKHWNTYPDEVAPVEVEPVVIDTRTPSEIAEAKRFDYFNKIVAIDPRDNKEYAEADLAKLSAEQERFLRRYAEKGHSGSDLYDCYLQIKDIQQRQAVERDRIAAEGR